MSSTTTLRRACALALAALFVATTANAQNAVHTHIGHVADAFGNTPNGQGLLPTAVAEAEVALQHASFAASDLTNLNAMRMHAGHVLNALDPSVVAAGPGAGYGVKAGASGALQHMQLAARADGASENVTTHANHITTALQDVVQWTDEAIGVGQRLQSASSAADAAPLATQLQQLCQAIASGRDANGDGRIGWQEGEGGLAQATQHTNLLKRGEGMAP